VSDALRLLAVLAHPDDESLGFGGCLAKYAAEGIETAVVTATRGDAGRFRGVKEGEGPGHPGREALARIREGELRAAAAVLGIRDLTLLGYPDGALDQVDPIEAVGRIAQEIRRLRPHVVVSFGPEGAYGHPDHIAISQFTTAAIVAAASPACACDGIDGRLAPHAVSKLYYLAWPQSTWNAYEAAIQKLTSTVDGVERYARAWPDWAITTEIDARAASTTAWRAVGCHQSQLPAYERLAALPPAQHEAIWGRQSFYRVFSAVNGGRSRESDLFEGIDQ
jgi:LmbE family N-acetylglucosaminyl deacetylase